MKTFLCLSMIAMMVGCSSVDDGPKNNLAELVITNREIFTIKLEAKSRRWASEVYIDPGETVIVTIPTNIRVNQVTITISKSKEK